MRIVFATLLIYLHASCTKNTDRSTVASPPKRAFAVKKANASQIAVITFDPSWDWLFKNSSSAKINQQDLLETERLLKVAIQEYNAETKPIWTISDLSKYKRQYVVVLNEKGQKLVWVNCFCDENPNWSTQIVSVEDGGRCYFNLKVNLTTGTYYDLIVNGLG